MELDTQAEYKKIISQKMDLYEKLIQILKTILNSLIKRLFQKKINY